MPLPQRTLDLLRAYWRTAAPRPRVGMPRGPWLFANREATEPLHATSLQTTFAAVVRTSGLTKHASIQTLRHSYATYLLRGALRLSLVSESELSVVPRREHARLAHHPRDRAAAGALLPRRISRGHVYHPAAATLHETLRLTHRVMRPTSPRGRECPLTIQA